MNQWNPDYYLKYEYERTLPARDLAARIDLPDARNIIDVGCGPGNSTAILRRKWPTARLTGLDSSMEMIRKARETYNWGEWIVADAETWRPAATYDIIFSNAALQWMKGQEAIITRLFQHLNEDGVLAVQVPLNNDSPIYRALLSVSGSPRWRPPMTGCAPGITYNDERFYYDILCTMTSRLELWLTTYLHVMDSHRDLIDWYSSTGFRPYLECIPGEEGREQFKQQILDECKGEYPYQRDGKVIFPFRRLFFIARKRDCKN